MSTQHKSLRPNTPAVELNDRFVNDVEAGAIIDRSPSTLRYWRLIHKGPNWYKQGRAARYNVRELLAWAKSQPAGGDPAEASR